MKSSRNVHFEQAKGKAISSPVDVPPSEPKSRAPKGRRGSVHWQHPEIPTTITEGHVLVEVQKKANPPSSSSSSPAGQSECLTSDRRGSESVETDSSPKADSILISRDRSHSLPTSTLAPFRLLRDRNWFLR